MFHLFVIVCIYWFICGLIEQIMSPVAGVAKPLGEHSIVIKPYTAGFTDYDIILSNILLSVDVDDNGTFVDAGQVRLL